MTGRPGPNFRFARTLFIREASASFVHSLINSGTRGKSVQVLEENLLQLGVTPRRDFGLSLGISWLSGALLFLVKEYSRIFCSVFGLSILRNFLLGFITHEGFPR